MDDWDGAEHGGQDEDRRQLHDRETSVNAPFTDAQIEDAIERLTGRWFIACLKTWGNLIVAIAVALAPVWAAAAWHWIKGHVR